MRIAGMVYQWDLWPWMVADGAGPMALALTRVERSVRRTQEAIGQAMYPVIRVVARSLARVLADA